MTQAAACGPRELVDAISGFVARKSGIAESRVRNIVERIVLMSPNIGPITREEIRQVLPRPVSATLPCDQTTLSLDEVERLHIERVLDASAGNKTKAAQILHIDYKTLLAKLKKYERGT